MTKKTNKAKPAYGPSIDLRAVEEEVLCEGQEWMRNRLHEKPREKAADFSPDEESKTEKPR